MAHAYTTNFSVVTCNAVSDSSMSHFVTPETLKKPVVEEVKGDDEKDNKKEDQL